MWRFRHLQVFCNQFLACSIETRVVVTTSEDVKWYLLATIFGSIIDADMLTIYSVLRYSSFTQKLWCVTQKTLITMCKQDMLLREHKGSCAWDANLLMFASANWRPLCVQYVILYVILVFCACLSVQHSFHFTNPCRYPRQRWSVVVKKQWKSEQWLWQL